MRFRARLWDGGCWGSSRVNIVSEGAQDTAGTGTASEAVSVPLATKTSDLPARLASAAVMLAVAGVALWAGGIWLDMFIGAVVLATQVEFVRLVLRATGNVGTRIVAIVAGAIYIGLAGYYLARFDTQTVIGVIGAVVCVDSFAYFTGRALGGPKIAPRISPSKTWAGLLGGIIGATLWLFGWSWYVTGVLRTAPVDVLMLIVAGIAVAVAAQSGDFFESWLKRRAGVKDSSNLIPGHGGVFDRTDGLIPVAILAGVILSVAN